MRLGLIEACRCAQAGSSLDVGIRGACASASLKLRREKMSIQGKMKYPRRMRLGLIEAQKER